MKLKKPKYYVREIIGGEAKDYIFYIRKNRRVYYLMLEYIRGEHEDTFFCSEKETDCTRDWSDKSYREIKPAELVLMFSPDQLNVIENATSWDEKEEEKKEVKP